jgi:hypothetical protein
MPTLLNLNFDITSVHKARAPRIFGRHYKKNTSLRIMTSTDGIGSGLDHNTAANCLQPRIPLPAASK